MNPRERFWKFANFEPIDHLPNWSDWLGPWEAWKNQGLPVPEDAQPGVFDERAWFIKYFGFDGMYSAYWGQPRLPVNLEICPAFETEIIEETDNYISLPWRQRRHLPPPAHPGELIRHRAVSGVPGENAPRLGEAAR